MRRVPVETVAAMVARARVFLARARGRLGFESRPGLSVESFDAKRIAT